MRFFILAMLTLIVIVEVVLRAALVAFCVVTVIGLMVLVFEDCFPEILTPSLLPVLKEYTGFGSTNTPRGGANGLR